MIKDLLQLLENRDVEVKDLAAYFSPERFKKALDGDYTKGRRGLWGSPRLVYKGKRFFTDDNLGSVYMGAEEAAHDWVEENEHLMTDTISTNYGDINDVEFELGQECYLGYDKQKDSLVIGFELQADHRTIDDGIEELLDQEFGEDEDEDEDDFDEDDEDAEERRADRAEDRRQKQLQRNVARREMIEDMGMGGALFYLHSDDGENFTVVDTHIDTHHSFYEDGGCHDRATEQGLIHLRLD